MGLKFGHIGPWTVELADLERLKNPHRLTMGEMLCNSSAFNFFILAGKINNYKNLDEFEFRQDSII